VTSDIDKAFRADMDKYYELLDPRIIHAARELSMSVSQAKEQADTICISLAQILGIEEAPKGEISRQYVIRGPLVSPEEEASLSTHMRNMLSWYNKEHIKKKNMKEYFSLNVREEHHFKR
jgi:hypothetical protein